MKRTTQGFFFSTTNPNHRAAGVEALVPSPRHSLFYSTIQECITCPPSIFNVWPVMFRACSEARKTAMEAYSTGVCHRPNGDTLRIFSPPQLA